jgi:exodeoxyribonuclease VII small subunit
MQRRWPEIDAPQRSLYLTAFSTEARPVAKKTDEKLDFEQALQELETLVDRLEKGDLSLEESLQAFERGITLTRTCQSALEDAEQKVRQLTAEGEKDLDAPDEEA